MNSASIIVCAATVGATWLTTASHADENLNCKAYAEAAVAHQKQNVSQGCGHRGGAWSADFEGHRKWCLGKDVRMANLTSEDRSRKAALEICTSKVTACDSYTVVALLQNSFSQGSNCGHTGGRWSPNAAGHRAWCMKVPPEASVSETELRTKSLEACNASVGEDAQLQNIKLQNALQRMQQAMQVLSNVAKLNHDTSMGVIRKID